MNEKQARELDDVLKTHARKIDAEKLALDTRNNEREALMQQFFALNASVICPALGEVRTRLAAAGHIGKIVEDWIDGAEGRCPRISFIVGMDGKPTNPSHGATLAVRFSLNIPSREVQVHYTTGRHTAIEERSTSIKGYTADFAIEQATKFLNKLFEEVDGR